MNSEHKSWNLLACCKDLYKSTDVLRRSLLFYFLTISLCTYSVCVIVVWHKHKVRVVAILVAVSLQILLPTQYAQRYEGSSLLSRDALSFGEWFPKFRRSNKDLFLDCLTLNMKTLQSREPLPKLHGVTIQKTRIFTNDAQRVSDLS
jgi:hypothetical protein